MSKLEAHEQYLDALKQGLKEYKKCVAAGIDPHPAVLDNLLDDNTLDVAVYVGTVEIPVDKIVGTKSAGRIAAFSKSFLPLLEQDSEFALKWINLCAAHLGETGLRDPIKCYEYLGKFYVQEGNKRLSVMRFNEAPRIAGEVYRILPPKSDDPEILAYYEFVDFYSRTKLYDLMFRQTGCYAKLCACVKIAPDQNWTEMQRRTLRSRFYLFREAFLEIGGGKLQMLPEEAFLMWMQVHSYETMEELSSAQLKKSLTEMWPNLLTMDQPEPVVRTEAPPTEPKSVISQILKPHIKVAFVHQRTPEVSPWTKAHDAGRLHVEQALGKDVTVKSYFSANSALEAEAILEQAIADGAQVVFTTSIRLIGPTLKISMRYPKVRFFNCSVHMPYSTVHPYYCKIFEAKFITGAIAGAIAANSGSNLIGYVGSYPIFGVPAAINAFALGAQITNPNAQIELKWSCLPGDPTEEFLSYGVRVISNRDNAMSDQPGIEYGTYWYKEDGSVTPLGSLHLLWGNFYEKVIRSIMAGTWTKQPVNDWWGMKSGVIDVALAPDLPEGLQNLATILRDGLKNGTIDPFLRKITAQDGTEKNDGTKVFSTDELLHMDWLCSNVHGSIPAFDELLPFSRQTVQLLGIHREDIPDIQEVTT